MSINYCNTGLLFKKEHQNCLIRAFAHKLCSHRREPVCWKPSEHRTKSLDYDKWSHLITCQNWSDQHCSLTQTMQTSDKAWNIHKRTQHLQVPNTEPFTWTQFLFSWWGRQVPADLPTSTVASWVIPDAHGPIFGQLLQITWLYKGNRTNLARGNWIKHDFRQSPSWFCTVKQPRLQPVAAWGA